MINFYSNYWYTITILLLLLIDSYLKSENLTVFPSFFSFVIVQTEYYKYQFAKNKIKLFEDDLQE